MSACLDSIDGEVDARGKMRGEIFSKQPDWLTEAVRATIHGTRARAKVIADALARPIVHVYKLANQNVSDRKDLRAHEIAPITMATGDFAILDAIELRVGRIAFRLPAVNPHLDQMNQQFARTVKQFGSFIEENGDALADGILEPHEVAPLVRDIDAVIAMASEYRALILEKAKTDERKAAAIA